MTLKNIKLENVRSWWNTWFLVQEIHLHSRQTSTRNEQMPINSTRTRIDDQRKDHTDSKQRNRPKQLQTHNVLTDDVENINSTYKGRNLLLANKLWFVSWRTERMPQGYQRHSRVTLHRSTHPKWEQDRTEKSSYGLDCLQKGKWHGSAKLDNKLPQNVQNITWSHKLYGGNYENMESGIDSRRKKFSWNKDPKRCFPRRCSITLIIHNCHDAT